MTLEDKFRLYAGWYEFTFDPRFYANFVTLTNSPKNGHGLIYLSALLCAFSTPV